MNTKIRLIFLILFFFFSQKEAIAATPTLFPASKDQSQTNAAYNSTNNQFLAVWGDCRDSDHPGAYGVYCCCGASSGQSADIFAQLIFGNGSCLGGNFNIFGGNIGYELPNAIYNPDNNEYLVVAQGLKEDFNSKPNPLGIYQEKGYDIYGQRISANGQKVEPALKIAPNPIFKKSSCYDHYNDPPQECDDHQWHPRGAYSTRDHRFMIVWHDGRTRAQNYNIYPHTHPNHPELDVTTDGTTFKDIYGQIVGTDGLLIGNNFPVTIDPANNTNIEYGNAKRIQQYADITYDADKNRFFVVWEDDRDGKGNPHPPDIWYDRLNLNIYGGFFDTNGRPIDPTTNIPPGTNFPVNKDTTTAKRYTKVTYNPVSKEFMVVWQSALTAPQSGPYLGDYIKVYAQIIDSNGNKKGNPILIDDQTIAHTSYFDEGYPPNASVNVNPVNGKYFVTWENASYQIKAKWIEANGIVGQTFNLASGIQENKVILKSDGTNDYLITGYKRVSNHPVFVFKTPTVTDIINCPAEGGPPPITPTPTCDRLGEATIEKFNFWKSEFNNPSVNPATSQANFNCDQKINLLDFEIWRKGFSTP